MAERYLVPCDAEPSFRRGRAVAVNGRKVPLATVSVTETFLEKNLIV